MLYSNGHNDSDEKGESIMVNVTDLEKSQLYHKEEIGETQEYVMYLMYDLPLEDIMDFTIIFAHKDEEEDVILYSRKIEQATVTVARELARRMKEYLLGSEMLVTLWSQAIGENLGFKPYFNKGLERFCIDVARHSSTVLLHRFSKEITDQAFQSAIENELKKRGEI